MTISNTPSAIFRYVPHEFLTDFRSGKLRFGSLSYYQNIEDKSRRDMKEGQHVDRPGGGVTLRNLSKGTQVTGDFSFHNKIKRPNRVYCLCFSKSVSKDHLSHFDGAQACIKITDTLEFHRRIQKDLARYNRTKPVDDRGVMANHVYYYKENEPAPLDIKDPYNLPFLKGHAFVEENEYRFVFGRKNAFKLEMQITAPQHNLETEVTQSVGDFAYLQIGNIEDISQIIEIA